MKKLILPALRGYIGDWVFYCCVMPLIEIGDRVSYADEVHKNKQLSDMIQRELKEGRAGEIADYLATQDQRFFNSLVLAVYDRDPVWYSITDLQGRHQDIDLGDVENRDLHGLYRPLTTEQISWAVRQGDPQLATVLNATLADWKREGFVDPIVQRWIPVRITLR